MAEDQIRLIGDSQSLIQSVRAAVAAFVDLNEKEIENLEITSRLKQIDNAFVEVLKSARVTLTDQTVLYAKMNEQANAQVKSVEKLVSSKRLDAKVTRDQAIAERERAAALSESLAKSYLTKAGRGLDQGSVSTASFAEQFNYAKAGKDLQDFLIKNQITARELLRVHKDVNNKTIQNYEGTYLDLAKIIQRLNIAGANLGQGQAAAHQRNQEVINQIVAAGAQKRLRIAQALDKALVKSDKIAQDNIKSQLFSSINAQNTALKQNVRVRQQIAAEQERAVIDANRASFAAQTRAQREAAKAAKEQERAAQRATKSIREMTLSWESMVRLFTVQLAHRAIAAFTSAVREGTRESIELEKRIAEIQTLDAQKMPFDTWSDGLRRLSDSWGIDIMDQAEAAYETLSNQIAEGAEALRFLEESNRFAVTSVSKSADAMNLLSAVINAYGLRLDDTRQISAELFKTIDLGRVRASEMANTFGTIAVQAAQLGIPLEQLLGLVTTLTIRGVKYTQAATQIRGAMTKLLKPTEDMKDLFKELGVSSGEVAIKTYGMIGLFKRIQELTKGQSTEVAKLFNNQRGLTLALALTGDALSDYKDNVDEITNSMETYDEASKKVLDTAGKRLEIELNRIKNYFLIELGDHLIQKIDAITGGFKGIYLAVRTLTTFLTTAAIPAATAYALILTRAAIATPFGAVVTGLAVAVSAISYFGEKTRLTAEKYYEDWRDAARKSEEELKQSINNVTSELEKSIDDTVSRYAKMYSVITRLANKIISDGGTKIQQLDKVIKESTDTIVAATRTRQKELNQFLSRMRTDTRKAVDDIRDTFRESKDFVFGFNLDKLQTTDQKLRFILRYVRDINKNINLAGNAGDLKSVDELQKRRRELFEQYKTLDESIRSSDRNKLYNQKLYFRLLQQENREKLNLIRANEKTITQGERQAIENNRALKYAENLVTETTKFKLSDTEKIENANKFAVAISEQIMLLNKLLILQTQSGEKADVVKATKSKIDELNKIQVAGVINRVNKEKQLEQDKNVALLKEQLNNAQKVYEDNVAKLTDLRVKAADFAKRLTTGSFTALPEREAIKKAQELLEAFGKNPKGNIEEFREEIDKLINSTLRIDPETKNILKEVQSAFSPENIDVTEIVDSLKKSKQEYENIAKQVREIIAQNNEQVAKVNEVVNATEVWLNKQEVIKNDVTETANQYSNILNSLIEINKLAGTNVKIPQAAATATPPVTKAWGGHGYDNIHALLQRGEFVMNSASTRKFYSQMIAMNARPSNYAYGGSTNNIGDVNINYTSTGSVQMDVIEIGRRLRRELRRGTVTLS